MKAASYPAASLLLLSLFFASAGTARADPGRECRATLRHLHRQLDMARYYGDWERVEALEESLDDARLECDEKRKEAWSDHDVREKQREVQKRRRELDEARAGGSAEQITRSSRSLQDAILELKNAEARRATGR